MPDPRPPWRDDPNLDLLRAIPGAGMAARPAEGLRLVTRGDTTCGHLSEAAWGWYDDDGRCCQSCARWAYFGFRGPAFPPNVHTDLPVVECTWLELLRDAWTHEYWAIVEGITVFHGGAFTPLKYHQRGINPLAEEAAAALRAEGRRRIEEATARLLSLARARGVAPDRPGSALLIRGRRRPGAGGRRHGAGGRRSVRSGVMV
jgi:hypothetical protein